MGMKIVYERCCGVDVHKKKVVCCLRNGNRNELREYGTLTNELKEMADWLTQNHCEMVAMESTGSYWKPLYNIMELLGLNAMVVNASHMKAVPGRKTDVKDAEWIADLLQHGLLTASYIPDKEQRELREVMRYRKSLTEERSREINRLQKMLEGANVKLGNMVSNIMGKSSQKILNGLANEQISKEYLQEALDHRMQWKLEAIIQSVDGIISPVQRKLLKAVLDHIEDMTRRIGELDDLISGQMNQYEDAIQKLQEVPGLGRHSAEIILAEIGMDMGRFPTSAHIASWAGICPGNHESAGKKKSGRINPGNKALKTTLIQCSHAAVRNKQTYFHAQYERLSVRRGKNKAIVAVAHSMLVAIYHMLKQSTPYRELGADYFSQFNKEKKLNYYLAKIKALGGEVIPSTA
jgi:transposase